MIPLSSPVTSVCPEYLPILTQFTFCWSLALNVPNDCCHKPHQLCIQSKYKKMNLNKFFELYFFFSFQTVRYSYLHKLLNIIVVLVSRVLKYFYSVFVYFFCMCVHSKLYLPHNLALIFLDFTSRFWVFESCQIAFTNY